MYKYDVLVYRQDRMSNVCVCVYQYATLVDNRNWKNFYSIMSTFYGLIT